MTRDGRTFGRRPVLSRMNFLFGDFANKKVRRFGENLRLKLTNSRRLLDCCLCIKLYPLFPAIFIFICKLVELVEAKVQKYGSYEADRSQVYWRKGSSQATRHQGGQEERAGNWRSKEASSLQAWHSSPS